MYSLCYTTKKGFFFPEESISAPEHYGIRVESISASEHTSIELSYVALPQVDDYDDDNGYGDFSE